MLRTYVVFDVIVTVWGDTVVGFTSIIESFTVVVVVVAGVVVVGGTITCPPCHFIETLEAEAQHNETLRRVLDLKNERDNMKMEHQENTNMSFWQHQADKIEATVSIIRNRLV